VGADRVVGIAEGVELGLELVRRGCSGLAVEPFLHGLVEPFDRAAGLRMVGPGMGEPNPRAVARQLERDPAASWTHPVLLLVRLVEP